MDSQTAPAAPTNGRLDHSNLERIKEAFRAAAEQGFDAGLEVLLECAHEDCEFRPHLEPGRVLCGHGEIRAFYRQAAAEGVEMKLRASTFEEDGDRVLVNGSVRIGRPAAGFAESQISWTYTFRDGRLAEASSGPRLAG
jgi:ketosteroid isomerase-like protein